MKVTLIGYSGHSYVACDILISKGHSLMGYCETNPTASNPYDLVYRGNEKDSETLLWLKDYEYFVAIGNSAIRQKIHTSLQEQLSRPPMNAVHNTAIISSTAKMGNGVMIGPGAILNACSSLADGVICNSGAIVEHDCRIGFFSHIAPGAVLCGNVVVGELSHIGANATIKEGVRIGDRVIIGAGAVIINDVPSDQTVVGNPQREI